MRKNQYKSASALLLGILFMLGCTTGNKISSDTRKEREQQLSQKIEHKINSRNYKFIADRIIPVGFSSRPLNGNYDLQVKPDTIDAYLPYIGRAYAPPMGSSTNDMGIKFTSTDFTYNVMKGKKGWNIKITVNDVPLHKYSLVLTITSTGMASLQVDDINRQQVSFSGYLDLTE